MKLGNLTEDAFARLVRAAFDIALVLDKEGVIEDISVRKAELLALGCQSWIGLSWASTVTSESRVKVQEMLLAAQNAEEELRWRHVNHGMDKGADLPVQYAVLKLGDDGRVLALGRDMEAIAVLQRRLIETHIPLPTNQGKLDGIQDGGFAGAIDTDKVGGSLAVDGGIFK